MSVGMAILVLTAPSTDTGSVSLWERGQRRSD